jgi:hypothetical protein
MKKERKEGREKEKERKEGKRSAHSLSSGDMKK